MKAPWRNCGASPPAALALPACLTRARSSFPERAQRGRRPPPSGGRWVGTRVAGLRARDSCPVPPLRWPPSDQDWGDLWPPGGPLAAVPETRASGRGRPRRPHRPPGRSGRSLLTSANFWGPLGSQGRTCTRAPLSPRPGWASPLLVQAPEHPPGAAPARWRGASPPPCTPLQVNAEAKSSCHHSRSPSGLLSPGLIRAA